jgi:uroporphyrinogen-III synthase
VPSSGFTSEDLLDVEGLNLTNPHLDPRLQGPGKSGIGKKSQSKKDLNKKDSGKYELGTQCSGKGAAVVMAAPGGRDVLVAGLESKGWAVSKALVYQRRIVKPAEQTVQAILKARDMICIWTSTSALVSAQKNLPANVWAKILDAPALVISERIKHHLHQLGVSDISLTDGPGNADLVQSICSFADVQFSPGG